MEKKSVFRQDSLERLSSPERMEDYIRVSNPGVFMVLAAIIVLLVGVCAWGFVGRLESLLNAPVVANDGRIVAYVAETEISGVKPGMTVQADGVEMRVAEIAARPVQAGEAMDAYGLHVSGMRADDWAYPVTLEGEMPDGVYEARIVTESVAPKSFVLN